MGVFDQCFAAVVGLEGGYANNPADPGGATKFGVSQRSYPNVNIAQLTLDQAKAIYRSDFWAKIQGDSLPPPLAFMAFDCSVNCGVGRAARLLQQAVGISQDGVIGPATLAAVAKQKLVDVLTEFHARRMLFQLTLPTVTTFGLGWSRRLAHLPFAAMALENVPLDPITAPAPIPAPAPTPASAPIPHPPIDPAILEAIEVEVRKELEDKAYTNALNQRPQT